MPVNLPVLATFAVVIAIVMVLSRLGWPRLRLRTYNQAHGGLRVIELGFILSGPPTQPNPWRQKILHILHLARRLASPEPVRALSPIPIKARGLERAMARERTSAIQPVEALPGAASAATAVLARSAKRCAWAEFVVHITLKIRRP